MSIRMFRPSVLSLALMAASGSLCAAGGGAAEVEQEKQLGEMVVKSERPAVPANLPATTEGVSAKTIAETSNAVTSAETIQYLPSVHVRQRYIGDRNAILAMRTNSSISSAQTIVYADNLLLSNFTNNSFSTPPRWGMVSPNEIERVDVIYGPFSALYPGNSMGGVVQMTTRMPEKFEMQVAADAFTQRFKLYGTDKNFGGTHANASVGDRFGSWSMWISGDHLDSRGHPMTFGSATRKSGAPAAAGSFTVVDSSRLYRDTDTTGAPRIIVSSLGIDHTVQDTGKIKLAYDFSPSLRATYTLGVWQNKSEGSVDSYLRDAAGNTIYNAGSAMANPLKYVRIDGLDYTVSSAVPSRAESEHWMHGLSLKSNTRGEWDGEVVVSFYDQRKDVSRQASPINGFDSGSGNVRPGGSVTYADGTGWETVDLRGDWRPSGSLASAHQWSFGYHYDRYVLSTDTYNVASDWQNGSATTLNTNSKGKTETQALYLQDAWRFAPDWSFVAGARVERWHAYDGSNYNVSNAAPTPKNVVYADRTDSAISPKAMLSFQVSPLWLLRGAVGKAYRFPTVSEMFQTISLPGNVKTNDPGLKPEQVVSAELSAERVWESGIWRISPFWEDKRDALISQTDTTTIPGTSISSIQNVDKVRTRGIETSLQMSDLWFRGFDLSGSVTYADSRILRNDRNPAVVGKDQPRIPDWRATLVATYRASDRLSYSLAVRHSGRQWVNLQYLDINPNVYGTAVSSYTVADAKVLYRIARQWSASLGVNNLTNYKYYVNPNPYPQRTFFAGVKFDY